MTGAAESVLGRKIENVLKSFRTAMPFPFEVATGDLRMSGILVTIDSTTKKAERIERVKIDAQIPDAASYDSDDGKTEYYNSF
jgi:calcineurin-like phosphoesterase